MDRHPLPIDELKGSKAVEAIDLSDKRLEVASIIIIAGCIADNTSLKSLKCVRPEPDKDGRPASVSSR